jgi:hypothetical protein
MRSRALLAAVVVIAAACSSDCHRADSDTAWVGTITTDGNVTTVVNESGSVWGGTARLVEEASIGVDVGEPEYMLGQVMAVTADDERIYVLDRQPPVLRVYDHEGRHLRDIGGEGQGPGEFTRPSSVVVLDDGRVVVRDDSNGRFSVFDPGGELLDTWRYGEGASWSAVATVVGNDGTLYWPQPIGRDPDTRRAIWGFAAITPDGVPGEDVLPPELGYERPMLQSGSSWGPVPLSPPGIAELSPAGWLTGIGDVYRFELHRFDGTSLVIERRIEPIPVSTAQREWETLREIAARRYSDPSWTWDGPPVPATMPAFVGLFGDADGRIWVRRNLPSVRVEECTEEPQPNERIVACWEPRYAQDVFGPDGRYLGEAESPEPGRPLNVERGFVRADLVLLQTQDEAGTVMVKRYRLVRGLDR